MSVRYLFCKNFVLVCGFSFHFFTIIFPKGEVLNFSEVSLPFSFWVVCLVLYLKSHIEIRGHLDFLLCCILEVLRFRILHLGLRDFEFIFVKGGSSVSRLFLFVFFCMWLSGSSSTTCWKKCLFSIEWPLLLCERSVDCVPGGCFSALFCPIGQSVLWPVPHRLYYSD